MTSNGCGTLTGSRKRRESTESSSRIQPHDNRGLHLFFGDDGSGRLSDEEKETEETDKAAKGKSRKEPWDENVQRQERYHNDMMQVQRESLNTFKDFMSQMIDCFKKN